MSDDFLIELASTRARLVRLEKWLRESPATSGGAAISAAQAVIIRKAIKDVDLAIEAYRSSNDNRA